MAIPVARVHLAMAHAALHGLLPTPPKCCMMMMKPLPRAAILPNPSSPPKQPGGRADAAERWDAHKVIKPAGGPTSPPSSSGGRRSSDGESGSPGPRASSCERWDSDKNKKKIAAAAVSSSASRTSSPGRSSGADSEERWDARKNPAAGSVSSSSSSTSRGSKKGRGRSKRRPRSRATSSAAGGRWDAHKKPITITVAPRADELDDGEMSSTGSNDDVESSVVDMPPPLPQRALYAGPGFIASPHPSMLPMPSSLMIRVA
ncbi:unnamed protein product [Urochloa decumbens]|uniref:Uncharacterized protein n=1 Tax=Urochloa decumbens TaxID=240449 RepID=A0ABC8VUA8_9POAL